MKERYSEPQLDIVTFSIADVINTSYATPDDGFPSDSSTVATTNANGGMGGPNEGEFGDEWL